MHAGSLNSNGARRRSILISYFSEPLYASHLETAGLRSIRMDTTDRFAPSDFAWVMVDCAEAFNDAASEWLMRTS